MNNETCKIRKQQFLQAVRILAPGDPFIYQAACRIPEKRLPAFPGGATLEFVAAFQKLRESISIIPLIKAKANHARHNKPGPGLATSLTGRLSLSHAIQVKSAEYWLKLGKADEAVRALESLPQTASNHPSAIKVRIAALEVLRERTGEIVHEQ